MIEVTPAHLVGATLSALMNALVANRTGRSGIRWFFWGLLFGIFGVIYLIVTKNKNIPKKAPIVHKPYTPFCNSKMWYYLDSERNNQGPMSGDALHKALREAKLTYDSFIWNNSLKEWKRVRDHLNI